MSNHEIEVGANGNLELLLFPGLNTCLAIKNGTSKALGAVTSSENQVPVKLQGVNNNVMGIIQHTTNELKFDQTQSSYVAKWRGVSYGFFLQTVNNADENDGWWEAIRISPSQDITDYGYSYNSANTTSEQPLHIFHKIPTMGGDIVNQVSYSQGVIRDISKVLFQLNHEVGDRDFVDMNRHMRIHSTINPTAPPDGETRPAIPLDALSLNTASDKDAATGQPVASAYRGGYFNHTEKVSSRLKDEALSQFIDQGFDCIYLKIHGVHTGGRSPTRVTCTCAMNLELVYDEKALNCRFHMPAVYHPMHERIKGAIKAAEPNFLMSTGPGNSSRLSTSLQYRRSM